MVNKELFAKEGETAPDPGKVMKGIRWTNEISTQYAIALGTVVEGIAKTGSLKESSMLIDTKIDLAIKKLVQIKNNIPAEYGDTLAAQRVEDLNRTVVELFKGFQARINEGEFKTPQEALKYYNKNVVNESAKSFDSLFGTTVKNKILEAVGY